MSPRKRQPPRPTTREQKCACCLCAKVTVPYELVGGVVLCPGCSAFRDRDVEMFDFFMRIVKLHIEHAVNDHEAGYHYNYDG